MLGEVSSISWLSNEMVGFGNFANHENSLGEAAVEMFVPGDRRS